MIDIYLRAFRLYHKNYLPQTLACLLATIGEAILYIFIVFCFENLSVQNEPLQNGLLVLVLGLAGLFIRLISDLNLLEYGMARPTSDLQSGLFRHFLRIPARHYPALSFGELSNVLFSQIIAGWFAQGIVKSCYTLVHILVLFCLIAHVSFSLGLVSSLPIFILIFLVRSLGRSFINVHADTAAANARFDSFVTDSLRGILTVKLFNAAAFHVHQARKLARILNWNWLRADFLGEGLHNLALGLPLLAIPVFWVIGGSLVEQGQVAASQLVALYVVLNLLNRAIAKMGILLGFALNYGGQLKVLLDFFDHEQEGEQEFPFKQGAVDMQHLDFAYENEEQPVLRDFSLTIQPGEKLALAGQSGAGKSTAFAVLQGLEFPQQGQVLVDGTLVTPDNASALRQYIASVRQVAYLFDADLRFNLTLDQPVPDAELRSVLHFVGLESFIANLPSGLETRLGPNGFTVSGGEKVRLCLARAILLNRPILLLDEFTANIDSISEENILEQVLQKMEDKTIIVISHRLSSVRNFPRILYLDLGKIQIDGTHKQLLSESSSYKEMFGRQIM